MDSEQARVEAAPFWEDETAASSRLDVLGGIALFVRRWPFLLAMTLGGMLVTYGASWLLKPRFSSSAVFLPPTEQASMTENPLASLLKTPSSAIYRGLLLSQTVQDDVIAQSGLQQMFHTRDLEETRTLLGTMTGIAYDGTGFVTVTVTTRDPRLSQQLAEDYMSALTRLDDRMAVASAARTRRILEAEFLRTKNTLEAAEVELKRAQEASGVVLPQAQTQAGLAAIDTARAEIRARQVTLAALLEGQTEQSPEVVRLRSEIAQQQAQLGRLEGATGGASGAGLSAAQAPSLNLRFVQLEREVRYNQVLFDAMARQVENARVQESSAAPGVQVVDTPALPLHKSWPRRVLFAAAGAVAGLFAALAIVFFTDRVRVLAADGERSGPLRRLRQAARQATLLP